MSLFFGEGHEGSLVIRIRKMQVFYLTEEELERLLRDCPERQEADDGHPGGHEELAHL